MKAPISWLKEWAPVKAGAEEIAKRLTFAGLEVEGIEAVEGETVLEVNVTPNRGDCLSIKGLAREVAALYGMDLKVPFKRSTGRVPAKSAIPVSVARHASCPRYALAVIDGVKVGASPEWLIRRLSQMGVRSVNNVVDVTNYVLMELGQPLHAFDRAKIRGGRITVRNAKAGETLTMIDGTEKKLEASDLVIADAEGPQALAGVMGGLNSEVGPSTTSIVLECAFFDPAAVRRASRRLGLISESSYRFERRTDPEGVPEALERAVSLIIQVAGGTVLSVTDLYKRREPTTCLRFRPADVASVLGGTWGDREIRSSLQGLGIEIKGSGTEWKVKPPSHRGDIERPIDLIEEVARLRGLERIPEKFPALSAPVSKGSNLSRERRVRSLLVDLGFQETIHYSFLSPELSASLGEGAGGALLANPLSRDDSVLRTSLIPSLLESAAHHARHKMETLRIFELRTAFEAKEGERPVEKRRLAGLLMGARLGSHWSGGVQKTDFYDVKGVVERVLSELGGFGNVEFSKGQASYLHPGQQSAVLREGTTLGILGEVHPDVLGRFDLRKASYVFELDWETLVAGSEATVRFQEFSRTPVVERDLAVVVDRGLDSGRLAAFIAGQDPVISDEGNQIAAGKKSLAFAIKMGSADRTLTDEEVNGVFQRIIENVKTKFGAEIR
jgi:phenylalanyl-tRNA synthetase beta chain